MGHQIRLSALRGHPKISMVSPGSIWARISSADAPKYPGSRRMLTRLLVIFWTCTPGWKRASSTGGVLSPAGGWSAVCDCAAPGETVTTDDAGGGVHTGPIDCRSARLRSSNPISAATPPQLANSQRQKATMKAGQNRERRRGGWDGWDNASAESAGSHRGESGCVLSTGKIRRFVIMRTAVL